MIYRNYPFKYIIMFDDNLWFSELYKLVPRPVKQPSHTYTFINPDVVVLIKK